MTEYADVETLQANWDKQPIHVEKSKPDIIDLIAAFHGTWPLPAAGNILAAVADGDSVVDVDCDDYIIHIDRKKGYAYQEMTNDMADDFKAMTFQRSDGSQLLLMQWQAPEYDVNGISISFAYDYSPRARSLKLANAPLEGIRPAHPDESLQFWFPDDPATQLPRVCEYYGNYRYQIIQDCEWDGKHFIPQPLDPNWLGGIYKMVEMRDPNTLFARYAIVSIGGDIYMLLSDADDLCTALFYQPEDDIYSLVASNQGFGELQIFENGVIQHVGCGAGCATDDYILCHEGKNESLLSVYTLRDADDNIVEQTFTVGTKELSVDEGRKRLQQVLEQFGRAAAADIHWQNIR